MRIFQLRRLEDITGVSGVGIVAEGVDFGNYTVLYWKPEATRLGVAGLGIYRSTYEVEQIHGHGGKTVLEWLDYVLVPITNEYTTRPDFGA